MPTLIIILSDGHEIRNVLAQRVFRRPSLSENEWPELVAKADLTWTYRLYLGV